MCGFKTILNYLLMLLMPPTISLRTKEEITDAITLIYCCYTDPLHIYTLNSHFVQCQENNQWVLFSPQGLHHWAKLSTGLLGTSCTSRAAIHNTLSSHVLPTLSDVTMLVIHFLLFYVVALTKEGSKNGRNGFCFYNCHVFYCKNKCKIMYFDYPVLVLSGKEDCASTGSWP